MTSKLITTVVAATIAAAASAAVYDVKFTAKTLNTKGKIATVTIQGAYDEATGASYFWDKKTKVQLKGAAFGAEMNAVEAGNKVLTNAELVWDGNDSAFVVGASGSTSLTGNFGGMIGKVPAYGTYSFKKNNKGTKNGIASIVPAGVAAAEKLTGSKMAAELEAKNAEIVKTIQEAADAVAAAEKSAEQKVTDANAAADKKVAEAEEKAEQKVTDANAAADQKVADANAAADQKVADANAAADKKVAEAEEKAEAVAAAKDKLIAAIKLLDDKFVEQQLSTHMDLELEMATRVYDSATNKLAEIATYETPAVMRESIKELELSVTNATKAVETVIAEHDALVAKMDYWESIDNGTFFRAKEKEIEDYEKDIVTLTNGLETAIADLKVEIDNLTTNILVTNSLVYLKADLANAKAAQAEGPMPYGEWCIANGYRKDAESRVLWDAYCVEEKKALADAVVDAKKAVKDREEEIAQKKEELAVLEGPDPAKGLKDLIAKCKKEIEDAKGLKLSIADFEALAAEIESYEHVADPADEKDVPGKIEAAEKALADAAQALQDMKDKLANLEYNGVIYGTDEAGYIKAVADDKAKFEQIRDEALANIAAINEIIDTLKAEVAE